jgi:hypothetical protein
MEKQFLKFVSQSAFLSTVRQFTKKLGLACWFMSPHNRLVTQLLPNSAKAGIHIKGSLFPDRFSVLINNVNHIHAIW